MAGDMKYCLTILCLLFISCDGSKSSIDEYKVIWPKTLSCILWDNTSPNPKDPQIPYLQGSSKEKDMPIEYSNGGAWFSQKDVLKIEAQIERYKNRVAELEEGCK